MLLVFSILYNLLFLWSSSLVWSEQILSTEEHQFRNHARSGIIDMLERSGIKRDALDALDKCLDDLSNGLRVRDQLIAEAKLKVDKIWVTNQPQTLKTKVIVDGTVKVGLLVPKRIVITRGPQNNFNETGDLNQLEKRFNRASRDVNEIVDLVQNQVVRKDRANQIINGTIHFLGPIRADVMNIEALTNSTLINGISLADLRQNVLRKSGYQRVTGNWQFVNSNIITDRLKVNGLLNGINMSNILLLNSDQEQVVTGRLKIRKGHFKTLNYESINGIPKEELVLKARFAQPITGTKTFTRVRSAANINLRGNLNNVNWTHLIRNSVNIHSPRSIQTLRFATIPTINNLTARSVNNIRIDNLKAGLTSEELVKLSGRKTFRSISANKIILNGRLNDLSIPDDLVTLRSVQDLKEPITFEGKVTFISNLTIDKINGVDIVRDTVHRYSAEPQIVHGTKIFDQSVQVKNLRSKVTKLRHINLDTLDPFSEDGSEFVRRSNVLYDNSLTINGSLKVKRINGILIEELIDSLFSRSRDQAISWPTKFNGSLTIGSVIANKPINGLTVPQDLVQRNVKRGEQVITGRKTFETIFLESENQLIMAGNTLNGLNLNSLEKSIIKNDPLMKKHCYGQKRFSSVKVLGNIVAERVNGLILERDVMLVDRPQNITGKLVFNSDVLAYQISFPSGLEVRSINGYLVDKMLDDLVLHDSQSVTLENKDFRGGLVADSIDLKGTINGINLVNLLSSVVTLNSPQSISAPLKFVDEVVFDLPIDARSVNGANLQRTFSDFLTTSSSSPNGIKIIGNVKINGDLITGRLNHQPVEKLKGVIFQAKSDNMFDRPVIFNSSIFIDHLTIGDAATLDGISPSDLFPLDQPVRLDQPLTIRGNAQIDHQLIVRSGVINGCSLRDLTLFSDYRNKSTAVHFQQPINFNSVNILGNLRLIGKTINGIDVEQLAHQLQLSAPVHQKFNSTFTFADDVQVDELFIEGPINGVNLREIYADSVQQSAGYQKITGHKTFKSLQINNGDVTFNGPVELRGTINGVNVNKFYDSLIKPGTYNIIGGVKIFTSNQPIVLNNLETGSMSGVNLSDLVLTTSSETISTDTTFTGPVEVNNLQTRQHHGRQVASRQSQVQFIGPVSVKQLNVQRINGIPIENFVSSLRDSQLNGSYTINQLYIHGDLLMEPNSTINGIDLSDLANRSVDVRSSKFIPGSVTLAGQVIFEQGIELTNDTVNGPGASVKLAKSLSNATNSIEIELKQLEDNLKVQTMVLARAMAEIDLNKMNFESFDIFDYFNDFEIQTNHIEKISISKDYRPVNNSPRLVDYTQGLTQSIYLEYGTDRGNNCDRQTSIFDLTSTKNNNSPTLQDKLTNAIGKYFPLTTFPLEGVNQSISVSAWTNLVDCNITTIKRTYTSVVKFNYSSSNQPPIKSSIQLNGSDTFTDIKYFLDNNQIILITLSSFKTGFRSKITVYRCNPVQVDPHCTILPNEPSYDFPNAIAMELVNSQALQSKVLVIMMAPKQCSSSTKFFIYNWLSNGQKFKLAESEFVSTPNPSTMKLIDLPHRKLLKLIVANNLKTGICADFKPEPSSMVDIFEIVGNQSGIKIVDKKARQSIDLNGNSISSFTVGQAVYLALASKSADKTFIYSYNSSANQFEPQTEYTTKGVEDVQCFWSTPKQLLMVATTTDHHKAIIYNAIFNQFY